MFELSSAGDGNRLMLAIPLDLLAEMRWDYNPLNWTPQESGKDSIFFPMYVTADGGRFTSPAFFILNIITGDINSRVYLKKH
jgi:hypothetical protein